MTSNRGEVGVASIRLNGWRIAEIPLGLGNQAVAQIPLALDLERQQEIENILASYPRVTAEYLESRIRECQTAIKDFQRVKKETRVKIGEYRALMQAEEGKPMLRDLDDKIAEIAKTDLSHEEKVAQIKALKQGCTPYDTKSMQAQIDQFEMNMDRLDEAIQQENDSIAELNETKGMIAIRDNELRGLGVMSTQ
jgi:hypothetical protein